VAGAQGRPVRDQAAHGNQHDDGARRRRNDEVRPGSQPARSSQATDGGARQPANAPQRMKRAHDRARIAAFDQRRLSVHGNIQRAVAGAVQEERRASAAAGWKANPGRISAAQFASAITIVTLRLPTLPITQPAVGCESKRTDRHRQQPDAQRPFAQPKRLLDVGHARKPVGNQGAVGKKDAW
jgi:hypothetical protein